MSSRKEFEKWVNAEYPTNLMMRNVLLDNIAFFDAFSAGCNFRQSEIGAAPGGNQFNE